MDKQGGHLPWPGKFLRTLKLIHLALVAAMVFLALAAYALRDSPLTKFTIDEDLFIYLVPVAGLAGYFGGLYFYKKLLSNIGPEMPLNFKLARFQTASLIKYACLEAPALLSLFAYMNVGYMLYLVIAACLIAYLYTQRPTLNKLISAVPLSSDERALFAT